MVTTPSFSDPSLMSKLSARGLLNIEAVLFNAEKPFIFTSGWASPVYIDCRKIISFPRVRSMMIDFAVSVIMSKTPYENLDSIAGGETAGIPYAAWIADHMGLPMQYVRKQPKGFGRMAQIEGWMPEGSRVLLVEDLATDGKSKITFAETLRKAGAVVEDAFAFFYYDIYDQAKPMLEQANLKLHSLVTWWDVLESAKEGQRFDSKTLDEVEKFLNDPVSWSAAHGGKS